MTGRVCLVGMGAIGRSIVEGWMAAPLAGVELTAVCVRSHQVAEIDTPLPNGTKVVTDLAEALEHGADIVIEAAGQTTAASIGPCVLQAGADLYLLSVGCLADQATYDAMRDASAAGGGRIVIVSGALAGFDGLGAFRQDGLQRVQYTSINPPRAWRGTPAEEHFALDRLEERTTIFRGNAAEAARSYPKNANLAAAVAIAGVGFARTSVELIADPRADGNEGIVEAWSESGYLKVQLSGKSTASNPKTSAIVGSSVLAALNNRQSALQFA